jgi:hypothetical protein
MLCQCSYCRVGEVRKEDLPCDCPHCGRRLTKIVNLPPKWVQDIQDKEDKEFLEALEQTIKALEG